MKTLNFALAFVFVVFSQTGFGMAKPSTRDSAPKVNPETFTYTLPCSKKATAALGSCTTPSCEKAEKEYLAQAHPDKAVKPSSYNATF